MVRNTPEEAAIERTLRMPAMVSRPGYGQVRLTLRLTVGTFPSARTGGVNEQASVSR